MAIPPPANTAGTLHAPISDALLLRYVREALAHLHDVAYLETHPLAQLVASHERTLAGKGLAVKQRLEAAVAQLRPDRDVSPKALRAYRLLRLRYIDGLGIIDVCHELGIRESEYYRTYRQGLRAVASLLRDDWTRPKTSVELADAPTPEDDLPHRSPMVGRSDELWLLGSSFDAVEATGRGSLVLISGEPGIGKTRLAEELGSYVTARGGLFVVSRFSREGVGPYDVWVQAMQSALSRVGPLAEAEIPSPYLGALQRLLPDLLPATSPEREDPRADEDEERRRLFEAMRRLFQAVGRKKPIALLLDDVHWAPSLSLLPHLVTRFDQLRMLIVCTYREQEFNEQERLVLTWSELNRRKLFTHIPLTSLEASETTELIQHYVGVDASKRLAEPIHQRAQGNPFFVEELIRSLVERGVVQFKNGSWRAEEPVDLSLPASAKLVVRERVSRLGRDVEEVLVRASVLTPVFSFAALEAITGRPEDELVDLLDRAISAGLILDRSTSTKELFGFADDYCPEVLYSTLSTPRRRRLHLKAGQALEAMGDLSDRDVDELAHHFVEAGEAQRGVYYARRAAERAEKMFSWSLAIKWYRAALELLEDRDESTAERAELNEKVGELCHRSTVNAVSGIDHLEDARALYEQIGNEQKVATLHRKIAAEWMLSGNVLLTDFDRALGHLSTAREMLERQGPSVELGWVYTRLSEAHAHQLDIPACIDWADRAIAMGKQVDSLELIAEATIHRGVGAGNAGDLGEARRLFEIAWELTSAHHFATQADLCRHHGSAVIGILLKSPAEALAWAARSPGFDTLWSIVGLGANRIALHVLLGQLDQARAVQAEQEARLEALGQPSFGNSPALVGSLLQRTGEWDAATEILERGLAWSKRAGRNSVLATRHLGELYMVRGQYSQAEQHLLSGYEAASRNGAVAYQIVTGPCLARLYAEDGRSDRAVDVLAQAERTLADASGLGGLAGEVHLAAGVVRASLGDASGADESFARALATHREYTLVWDEAKTLYEWGKATVSLAPHGPSDVGLQRLREALNIWETMGAEGDAALCRQALNHAS